MARIKFEMGAGFMTANYLRRIINKLKRDILWHEPEARIAVTEDKSIFSTRICFIAENIKESTGENIKDWYYSQAS